MYKKGVEGWMKHFDFILLDILVLEIAYALAFYIRKGSFTVYRRPLYANAALVVLVTSLCVSLFTDNHKNAQIVATTHSPTLLTETAFRHDQVWFVSKNDNGVTSLASLADFTGIRGNFARIVKDYLHGCFGAVPNIRNLNVEGDA